MARPTMTEDTYANIQLLTPAVGDQATATDMEELQAICFSAGTWTWTWRGVQMTIPPTAGWSWVNQGGATISTNGPVQTLDVPGVISVQARLRVRSCPATPWTLRAWLIDVRGSGGTDEGLVLRESSTGEVYRFGWWLNNANARGLALYWHTSASGAGTAIVTNRRIECNFSQGNQIGLEIEDNGTNLIFKSITPGGTYTWLSEGRTTRMAGGPDEFGFYGSSGISDDSQINLVSWDVS